MLKYFLGITITLLSYGDVISNIQIVGNDKVDKEAILIKLQSKPGEFNNDLVTSDIKTLYSTGFFDSVEAERVDTDLVFRVKEKPSVRKVLIKGNSEVSESELSDILNFGTLRFVDSTLAQQIIKKAEVYYQEQGYYDAKFSYNLKKAENNQVDVVFNVEEGPRYKISEIVISGLEEADEDDILAKMQTKEYVWWKSWITGSGRLNRELLTVDKDIIQQELLNHGFVDVRVSQPTVEKSGESLVIKYDVTEGEKYQFGKIKYAGKLNNKSEKEVVDDLKIKTGAVFSAAELREDVFGITDKLADLSYAFANVVPKTSIDPDNKLVDVNFEIDKGQPVNINQIKILGNDKTYENVIRRELTLQELDPFSKSKIDRSRVLLNRLGYFEDVSIETKKTEDPKKVDLLVNVREASTGSISVGAGYSTNDGAIFTSSLSENNFMGTGRRIGLNADIGSRRNNFVLSLDDRRFMDSFLAVGADLSKTLRVYDDFERDSAGGGLSFGYPLEKVLGTFAEDVNTGLKYDFNNYEIGNVDLEKAAQFVVDSEGKTSAGTITPRIVRNTIDNPINPTEGTSQTLSYEMAGFGGDEDYTVIDVRNQIYQPLLDTSVGKFVFSLRTNYANGESNNSDRLPLFRRFFPGGINSVRGFQNRTLGPTDEKGAEFGGSKQFVNNAEIIFPLVNSAGLKGIVFYDVGQAFDDNESLEFNKLRKAYGTGVRWASPLGPIRLEIGFPLDKKEGESSAVTAFSFGAPF